MLSALVAVIPASSVTWTENEYVPAVVGVPLHAPLVEKESPGGLLPEVRDQA
jgi:hypothetical protein